jgi:hypothetical protein
MTTTRKKTGAQVFLESFPVATVVHLLAALALCIVFVSNGGHLTGDEAVFFGVLLGANSIGMVGRGLAAHRGTGVSR